MNACSNSPIARSSPASPWHRFPIIEVPESLRRTVERRARQGGYKSVHEYLVALLRRDLLGE